MKLIRTTLLATILLPIGVSGSSPDAPPQEIDPLVATFDHNGNGKIDVEERRDYVRELSAAQA